MAKNANGLGSIYFDKNAKIWRASITLGRGSDGKLKRKSFTGKTQKIVKEKMDKFLLDNDPKMYLNSSAIKFVDLIRYWFNTYEPTVIEATVRARESRLRNLFDAFPELSDLNLNDMSTEYIEQYLFYYLKTHNYVKVALHLVLNFAVSRDYLKTNPLDKVNFSTNIKPKVKQKAKVVFTSSENKALLEELNKFYDCAKPGRYFYYPMMMFLYWTGLRMGERCVLEWKDVDFDSNVLTVNKTLTVGVGNRLLVKDSTKTNVDRKVPLHTEALKVLNFLKEHPEFTGSKYIFVKMKDHSAFCNPSTPRRTLENICMNAQLDQFSFHFFRHNFISMLINSGASPVVVRDIVGHSNPSITLDVYSHSNDELAQESINLLNRVAP